MPHSIQALLIGFVAGIIMYLITRYLLGERADAMIGGVSAAFFVSPWWAALAGAIFGHVLAVAVVRKMNKKKLHPNVFTAALLVMAAYVGFTYYFLNSTFNEVKVISTNSLNKSWAEFAAQGPANAFVAENYRSCAEATSYTLLSVNTKHDPSVCRSSAVSLAASTKGQSFGIEVEAAINAWSKRKPVDPEADAKIAKLLASI